MDCGLVDRPFCIIILRCACSKKKHANCVAYAGGPLAAFSFPGEILPVEEWRMWKSGFLGF